jgi:hypothetical protein
MIVKLDNWSIVLAGHWNRMIFTPEWVSPRFFEGREELETMVALLPILPIIYRDNDIAIEVATSRVIVRPRNAADAILVRMEQVAVRILRELNNTPITGVGVNFGFVERNPTQELLDLVDLPDNPRLAQAGWEILDRKIVRQLRRAERIVNFTIAFSQNDVLLDFNFHTETRQNEVARQSIQDSVLRLRGTALGILTDQYRLQLTEDGENHE